MRQGASLRRLQQVNESSVVNTVTADDDTGRLLDAYLVELRASGLSPGSIRQRIRVVRGLAKFAAPRSVVESTEDDVSAWIMDLQDRELGAQTVRSYIIYLRAFFRRCVKLGICETDPTAWVALPPRVGQYWRPARVGTPGSAQAQLDGVDAELLDSYSRYMRACGDSEPDVEQSREAVTRFADYIGIDLSVTSISPQVRTEWRRELRTAGLSFTNLVNALDSFMNWCHQVWISGARMGGQELPAGSLRGARTARP